MKKIFGFILCIAILISCAAFAETAGQPPAEIISGDYDDATSQRATMHVEAIGENDAIAQISWGNGANEMWTWQFTCTCGKQEDDYFEMDYTDCVKSITRFEGENSEGETETVYENGTGKLTCYDTEDGRVIWQDDVDDAGNGCVFLPASFGESVFTAAGVQIDDTEENLRAALGNSTEEKTIDSGKELIYSDVRLENTDVEAHFIIMDDMVRAMCFTAHQGNAGAANDISEFILESSDDTEGDITEERIVELGEKYFGITDFSQLGYFSRYAKDGTMLVYLRTSETDIHMLALDQYLQNK